MENNNIPTEEKPSLDQRIKDFNIELEPLLKKHGLLLASETRLTPDGRVTSRAIVVDESVVKKETQGTNEKEGGEPKMENPAPETAKENIVNPEA